MTLLSSLLTDATKKIGRKDALWLLSSLINKGQAELLLGLEAKVSAAQKNKFSDWVKRRKKGEPLQYITGRGAFFGREFFVGPGVLAPRPETESLVEITLREGDRLQSLLQRPLQVFDVGLGSGCIALTLLLERKHWLLAGSEPSAVAIKYARKNSKATALVMFRDYFLNPVISKQVAIPDVVVANPPYLDRKKDKVEKSVLKWEPEAALFSASAGAWHAEQIFVQCLHIRPRLLILELSARVAARLEKKWKTKSDAKRVWREPDLTGRRRFLLVEFAHG